MPTDDDYNVVLRRPRPLDIWPSVECPPAHSPFHTVGITRQILFPFSSTFVMAPEPMSESPCDPIHSWSYPDLFIRHASVRFLPVSSVTIHAASGSGKRTMEQNEKQAGTG